MQKLDIFFFIGVFIEKNYVSFFYYIFSFYYLFLSIFFYVRLSFSCQESYTDKNFVYIVYKITGISRSITKCYLFDKFNDIEAQMIYSSSNGNLLWLKAYDYGLCGL